jgi:DNA-binding CsgD family transcriptional regulator
VLTPREYEVLSLIRDGLSNREIAKRLGITLGGAKFHVSEIITKLGVSSREEAAQWEAGTVRHWSLAFLSWPAMLRLPGLGLGNSQLIAGVLGLVLVGGLATGGWIAGAGTRDAVGEAAAQAPSPTLTPEMPDVCRQVGGCMVSNDIRTEVASLDEAAALTSFVPHLPTYIPEEFTSRKLIYSEPGPLYSYEKDGTWKEVEGKSGAGDELWATYGTSDGRSLIVVQGFEAAPTSWYEAAPDDMKGVVELEGKELQWIKGGPKPVEQWEPNEYGGVRPVDEGWDNGGYNLYWLIESQKTGTWEISPDGERHDVAAGLYYAISSESLPLDELVKIAASVP